MRGLKHTIAAALLAAAAGPIAFATPAAAATTAPLVLYAAGAPTASGSGGIYNYNPTMVPGGARLAVVSISGQETRSWLTVAGLRPNWTYMVHLHQNPCGPVPTAAGGHYQQVVDPVQPSTDPRYLNPVNEVWLNVTTNKYGFGTSTSVNPWHYRAAPGSLVLHAGHPAGDPAGAPIPPGTFVTCATLSAP